MRCEEFSLEGVHIQIQMLDDAQSTVNGKFDTEFHYSVKRRSEKDFYFFKQSTCDVQSWDSIGPVDPAQG